MPKIFISYRRADSRAYTGRIYDRLMAKFGKDNVFKDVDNIPLGADFPTYIDNAIADSDILLVIIGQQWITLTDESGMRRIDNPDDFVRLEIEAGLRHAKCLLIPVLVDDASMPRHADLPDSIRKLGNKNAAPVRDDPDFHRDIDRLLEGIESANKSQPAPQPVSKRSRVYDLLPAPFAWIDIPVGEVTLEKGGNAAEGVQTFVVPAFTIAKYPLTNAQFAKFQEAGGYAQKKWWMAEGWEAKEQGIAWHIKSTSFRPTGKAWTEPRYWRDKKWNGADCPVVGVSWYEALAYCAWLSDVSGERILLPTGQQWQRAAQGDDGRVFPWGNEWECTKCNNSVSPCQSSQTSPVTQYEGKDKGDSPFGITDMVGNVWEWCSTTHASGSRSLCGGSWDNYESYNFRVGFRSQDYPLIWNHKRGFRLALAR